MRHCGVEMKEIDEGNEIDEEEGGSGCRCGLIRQRRDVGTAYINACDVSTLTALICLDY